LVWGQVAYWKNAAQRQHTEKRHIVQLLQESEAIHGLTHGSMLMYQAECKRLLCQVPEVRAHCLSRVSVGLPW
jgi:hypothetical protein